jgi:hypothetical protein
VRNANAISTKSPIKVPGEMLKLLSILDRDQGGNVE